MIGEKLSENTYFIEKDSLLGLFLNSTSVDNHDWFGPATHG